MLYRIREKGHCEEAPKRRIITTNGGVYMEKRRYTHMRLLETVIDELLTQGKTHKEIERELGLKGKQPVHDFLKKRKRKERKVNWRQEYPCDPGPSAQGIQNTGSRKGL